MKTNKPTASKSTELTDAPESKVSTLNPDFIMKSDNSINSTPAVNSDNANIGSIKNRLPAYSTIIVAFLICVILTTLQCRLLIALRT